MDWLKIARSYKQNMIDDLCDLVKIRSLLDENTAKINAPFGDGLREVLDVALAMGTRDGFKVMDIDGYAGIIEYGDQDEAVGMLGHLDVVPVSDTWTKDPFNPTIENGYLYARGSADDKGPTIAAYYALKMLKDHKIELKRRIQLILGCYEETGMRCMHYYKKHHKQPLCGFVPDATFPVVYAEKGILDLKIKGKNNSIIKKMTAGQRPNIVITEAEVQVCGNLKEELFMFYLATNDLNGDCRMIDNVSYYHIKGVGAHGARPYNGINAAWHILNFVGSAYDDQYAKNTATLLKDWMGKGLDINFDGVHLGFLTVNLGMVMIDDKVAELVIDIRYPNDIDSKHILTKIENKFKDKLYEYEIEIITDKPPLFVDPNSSLIKILMNCYQEYTNDHSTPPMTMSGGTYARTLENFVGFGANFVNHDHPSTVGVAHEDDEAIKINNIIYASSIYAKALIRLANDYENAQ